MVEAIINRGKNRLFSRELTENHLYIKPHHVSVLREGFGTLYYLSKGNFTHEQLRQKLITIFPPSSTPTNTMTCQPHYIDMVGFNMSDYQTFIEKNVQIVEAIPFYKDSLPVTITATEEDALCRTCIFGQHCRRYAWDKAELQEENSRIESLVNLLGSRYNPRTERYWSNMHELHTDTTSKAHKLQTNWKVLKEYYEEAEYEYYIAHPDRR
ncbi:MAG TPA: hypothetical protein VF189_00330 [Patescibacteria group bacterium]